VLIGLVVLLVLWWAVYDTHIFFGGLSQDSSCRDWNNASSGDRTEFVHSDGYYSDASRRVQELDTLCSAVTGDSLGDLRDAHHPSDLIGP
jgi:hypothetical protein